MASGRLVLLYVAALAVLAATPGAATDRGGLSYSVTLTSEYVFRGIALSDGAAIQAGVEYEHGTGLFGGVWASTLEIPSSQPGTEPRDLEVDYYGGLRLPLAGRWSAELAALRYTYPGAPDRPHYDYTEIAGAVHFRDRMTLALTTTDDAFGFGVEGWFADVTGRLPLSRRLHLTGSVGAADLDGSFFERYRYWSLAIAHVWGGWTAELGYYGTDGDAERVFEERADGRVAASLTFGG